jgi:ABC-type transport system substrate-binding protein
VRRVTSVATAVLAATLLLAASGSPRDSKEGGTFRVAVRNGRVDTIDPALVNFFPEGQLLDPACARLMAHPDKPLPAGGRLAPSLAAAAPVVSKDGRTYTFTIRKDARFSDGSPVTAQAFGRAIERLLDPAMDTPPAVPLADLLVGGNDVLAGKAKTPSGVTARGRTLTLRLTRKDDRTLLAIANICAVPPTLLADPEGAKAPLQSPAPYYVSEYVPGERLVLQRNPFYTGERPHHVARFVADLTVDPGQVVEEVAKGTFDTVAAVIGGPEIAGFAKRYGINKAQFWVVPGVNARVFHLNTSQPLFRNNPKLRQAVNFAVNRKALAQQAGPQAETPTDQFLVPGTPGYRDVRIYPFKGDLKAARALAKGRTRSGKAALYTPDSPVDVAQAQILKRNLQAIGLDVEIKSIPVDHYFQTIFTPGEPFDIARIVWLGASDPTFVNCLFNGRLIGKPTSCNVSYFNSSKYNRLLDAASRLTGGARDKAYGDLDVELARDAAPALPVSVANVLAFVSSRVDPRCVVMNPALDLTAVCLK